MKVYYKGLAFRKLRSRRTRSLLPYLSRSGLVPQRKSVKLPASKRSHWPRTMPSSKRSSMVNVKTLPSFVKHAFGLSQRLNVQGHSDSWTSLSEANFLYRYRITALSRVGGRQQKVQQSTCKTSSEAVSYAKQLWLPKAINLSLGIYRKLNREYSRGWVTTKICSTSSGQAVTLTRRLERRCLTYPASVKILIQTLDNLQRAPCLVADMALAGRPLLRSYLLASLEPLQSGTKRRLPRRSV